MSQDRRPAKVRVVSTALPEVAEENLAGVVMTQPAPVDETGGIGMVGWLMFVLCCAVGGAGTAFALRQL